MANKSAIDQLIENRAKLNSISPSFCLAKWKQVTLHLHNGNTQSCHHVKSHKIDPKTLDDPFRLHNTKKKQKARRRLLAGKKIFECNYCWRIEKRGEISDRIYKSSEEWAWPSLEQAVQEKEGRRTYPSYVELSFDSHCQFKCMYCSPAYSSKWLKEIEEFGHYPTSTGFNSLRILARQKALPLPASEREKYVNTFWKWWPDLAPQLRHLRVTGGEPLLSPETFRLIDELIARPRPHLAFAINTNMGLNSGQMDLLNSRIKALQKSVASVTLYTSLDSVGPQAEYIRFGLDFARFRENIRAILENSEGRLTLSFMITVNNLCLPGLRDLMAYILELRRSFPQHHIGLDTPYLRHPRHMSVELLPMEFTKFIDDVIEYMSDNRAQSGRVGFYDTEIQRVARIRKLIENSSFNWLEKIILKRDFYKMFTEYDRRRGTDFLKTFPEYEAFWRGCAKLAVI